MCFQEGSAVTDNQGDDGVDDEGEDVDAELQALVQVEPTTVYCRLAVKTMALNMTRYIWYCSRLVRILPRLTLFWQNSTMLIRSVLTNAVMGSCQADMQVYSSVYWYLCQPVVGCRQKLGSSLDRQQIALHGQIPG